MQGYSTTYFLKFPSYTRIFNGRQHSFQVQQELFNVPKSFSYKNFLVILATQGKEGEGI